MFKHKDTKPAATIVELLIVMIGILAATAYVVYSGIQKRAYNVQTISAARAYIAALRVHCEKNETYLLIAVGSGSSCPDMTWNGPVNA